MKNCLDIASYYADTAYSANVDEKVSACSAI